MILCFFLFTVYWNLNNKMRIIRINLCLFEIGSHCIALARLELTMYTRPHRDLLASALGFKVCTATVSRHHITLLFSEINICFHWVAYRTKPKFSKAIHYLLKFGLFYLFQIFKILILLIQKEVQWEGRVMQLCRSNKCNI